MSWVFNEMHKESEIVTGAVFLLLFQEVLEMKRDEFYALPLWKQRELKQCLGLF